MRRTHPMNIAQVIAELLGDFKLSSRIMESRIIAAWPEVLGPLAKPTDELYIKNNVLFVNLSSSVIRNELSMMRSKLVQRLNEKAGDKVITDIVFR
jgi:predicted nucleic acid-binding Zn ribbon protein